MSDPAQSITVYHYGQDNVYKGGTGTAMLDPLEWSKNQVIRYLVPRFATATKTPTIPKGKQAKWNGSTWDLVNEPNPTFIDIVNRKERFVDTAFRAECLSVFPACQITCSGADWGSDQAKNIKFDKIEDTEANRAVTINLIAMHDYATENRVKIADRCAATLQLCTWKRDRHLDQLKLVEEDKLTEPQVAWSKFAYVDFLMYLQNIRDFPEDCNSENPVYIYLDEYHDANPDNASNKFIVTDSGLINGDIIEFRPANKPIGTMPTGLSKDTNYYIVQAAAEFFKVSLALNGAEVAFTSNGVGLKYRKRYSP